MHAFLGILSSIQATKLSRNVGHSTPQPVVTIDVQEKPFQPFEVAPLYPTAPQIESLNLGKPKDQEV